VMVERERFTEIDTRSKTQRHMVVVPHELVTHDAPQGLSVNVFMSVPICVCVCVVVESVTVKRERYTEIDTLNANDGHTTPVPCCTCVCVCVCACSCACVFVYASRYTDSHTRERYTQKDIQKATHAMGWLRLVGSIKLLVSSAEEPYKRYYILQNRPII